MPYYVTVKALRNVTHHVTKRNVLTPFRAISAEHPGSFRGPASREGNTGGAFRTDNVDIVSLGGENFAIGWMAAGEWLAYDVSMAQFSRP